MRRSEKKNIAKAIYEDNLVVAGRRAPPPATHNRGKRIVNSQRRHPSFILVGVVIGLALAYSAVSISWDGPLGKRSVMADVAETLPSKSVAPLAQATPASTALTPAAQTNQTTPPLQVATINGDTPLSETRLSTDAKIESQDRSLSQTTAAVRVDSGAHDSRDSISKSTEASIINDSEMDKVAIEDSLDKFFHDADSMPTAESLAMSDVKAYKVFTNAKRSLAKLFGLGVRTIVIDPGHGGKDPGAVGHNNTHEKDIALEIGKQLRDRLSQYKEYHVLMTRDEDVFVPLSKRVKFANDNNADLFVSIHINSFHSANVNFIETYYFGPNKDTKVMRLAETENAHSDYVYAEFKGMIQKIGDTMKFQESKKLARAVQNTLYTNLRKINSKASNHGIKAGPFVVLLGLDAPSILTEVASLTNKIEEQRLNKSEYRDKIAEFLEKGIVSYLNKGTSDRDPVLTTAGPAQSSAQEPSQTPGGLGNASEEKEKLAQEETH